MDPIKPDKHTLSDLDKIAPPMLVKAFLFYKPPSDLPRLLESLQEGLKNAVHHLPFLAGDVQVDKDSGNGKPCIMMPPGGQGLELGVRYFSDDEYKPFSVLEGGSFSLRIWNILGCYLKDFSFLHPWMMVSSRCVRAN